MADLKYAYPLPDDDLLVAEDDSRARYSEEDLRRAMELLFFAYRDFTSDPDAILATYKFGRAHHRVIHFVGRNPDMSVAELLNILRITKQSLSRVLKQLVDRGYVEQRPGTRDRRQRLLSLTAKGRQLEERLSAPQRDRIARAFRDAGPAAVEAYRRLLFALINEGDRDAVMRTIMSDDAARQTKNEN